MNFFPRRLLLWLLLCLFICCAACNGEADDDDSGADDDVADDDDGNTDDDIGNGDDDDSGDELPYLHVEDSRVVGANGSTVILRGFAVNQLGDYFQANPDVPSVVPLTRKDFEGIAALGSNSIRLVIHWSLLEPTPGFHDEQYLERIREAVRWAGELGMYVILDMHQDAWGKYIASAPDESCPPLLVPNVGWDGAPEWATFTDGKSRCKLYQRELSPAATRAWESFWQDREGIQQHFVETWAWLAESFKNDITVAGYDLLNEPNWGEHLFLTIDERKPDFYRRAIEAIRQAEAGGLEKIVFFEPTAIYSFIPYETPVPFTEDPNIVYAPHNWCPFADTPELIRVAFETAWREAQAFGTTFWLGEFAATDLERGLPFAALQDEFQVGSAWWVWKAACGDPHFMADTWPSQTHVPEDPVGGFVQLRCGDSDQPEGVEEPLDPVHVLLQSRPYPRAFPSPAVFISDPVEGMLEMSGTASADRPPLEVWIPGVEEPVVDYDGLERVTLESVTGGWLLRAKPNVGNWRLNASANN